MERTNLKKITEIDLNFSMEEMVKNAPVATDLNKEVEDIVKYFNSEECRLKEMKKAQEIAELMPQVIGAEINYENEK